MCLHFVDDHNGARAVTYLADALEERHVPGTDAPLPLQSLHHDGGKTVSVAG